MSDVSTSVSTTVTPAPEGASEDQPQPGDLNPEGYEALKNEDAANEDATNGSSIDVRDQTFKVVANLPGIVLLDLGVASDPSATQGEQLRALREFLKSAIDDSDLGRFENLLRTAKPTIYIDELNEIVERLLGVVGGRPTE